MFQGNVWELTRCGEMSGNFAVSGEVDTLTCMLYVYIYTDEIGRGDGSSEWLV